jgi:catechol-2,3-dioxygenase
MEAKIRPSKFAHVVFRTNRYDEMVKWWCTVLEAEPVFANQMLTFLTYDDEHHRVAIARFPQLVDRPSDAAGLEHVAYTYASLGELLATYERLKSAGILPYWTINHGPTTSLYYRDPDGNQVELQVDNFATEEDLKAFFASGSFQQNPIGVGFDPDRLLARFRSGVPVEELVKQGPA